MSRIALVGAGYISRVHAEALKSVPGQTLACVIDPDTAAHALCRPLRYHPQSARFLWNEGTGKRRIKRATGDPIIVHANRVHAGHVYTGQVYAGQVYAGR